MAKFCTSCVGAHFAQPTNTHSCATMNAASTNEQRRDGAIPRLALALRHDDGDVAEGMGVELQSTLIPFQLEKDSCSVKHIWCVAAFNSLYIGFKKEARPE